MIYAVIKFVLYLHFKSLQITLFHITNLEFLSPFISIKGSNREFVFSSFAVRFGSFERGKAAGEDILEDIIYSNVKMSQQQQQQINKDCRGNSVFMEFFFFFV